MRLADICHDPGWRLSLALATAWRGAAADSPLVDAAMQRDAAGVRALLARAPT